MSRRPRCRPVAWGELRAGDLVFFTPSFKTSELHVGIFDGRGSFIHSPSPGGAGARRKASWPPYWRTAYYKGCRILPLTAKAFDRRGPVF